MPKIKPTTLFCKRTLPILLLDDSNNDMIKAAMLVQPIVDELIGKVSKVTPEVVHVENTGNATYNALKTIDALLSITQPTIVVAPGSYTASKSKVWDSSDKQLKTVACGAIAATAEPLEAYAKLLVAAGGGFIVHVTASSNAQNLNSACPVIHFDPNANSYIDIEYKVKEVVKRICSPDTISHYMTIQSVANNPWPHNKLALCLGSWGRGLWDEGDEVNPDKQLKVIVNVKGIPGSPITVEEFVDKVWCKPGIDTKLLTPENALIVRNPSIESKLVLAKVLSDKKVAKGINFIEV